MLSESDKQEMRAMYRDAKNKQAQVGILAQLYAIDKNDVLGVLGLEEDEPQAKPQKQPLPRKVRSYEQSVRREICKAVLVDGETAQAAAERYGVPYGTVYHWAEVAKRQRDGLVAQADEILAEQKGDGKMQKNGKKGACRPEGLEEKMRRIVAGIDALDIALAALSGTGMLPQELESRLGGMQDRATAFLAGMEYAAGGTK